MTFKQILSCALCIFFLILSSVAHAASEAPLNRDTIRTIHELKLQNTTHGIFAIEAETGKILIDINSTKKLNPASNVKMITAAVALKELGGDYRFKTTFSTDKLGGHGTIHNLYIKGNGDPFFVTEVTEEILKELTRKGVRKISGDIIVDESFFDGKARQTSVDNQRPYAAATASTALNFNSVRILVDRKGRGYEIKMDAPNDYVEIVNKLRPVGRSIYLKRITGKNKDKVIVSGGLPKKNKHFEKYVNISDPALYFGSAFKTLFTENGIPVEGKVREGLATGQNILLIAESKPLRMIVDDMNRFSNNFVAEQLVKHLGAVKFGEPGTTEKGLKLFDEYLESLGIPGGTYKIVNGSGLSKDNRLSARQLVAVLADAYRNPKISRDYISSLSVAGTKGTIKNRHKDPLLKGKLRGKTGTLNGVSTLTGYVPMKNGHTAIFAILSTGPASWKICHKLQDETAKLMASYR